MKIVIATPRTGSTFYCQYLRNTNHYQADNDLYINHNEVKYHLECFESRLYPKGMNEFDETTRRLSEISNISMVKIIVDKNIDPRVWNWLIADQVPVTVLKRKNIKRQILSFGLAILNDIWITYDKKAYMFFANKHVPIEQVKYKKGVFERFWFDDIVYRIKLAEYFETTMNVEDTVYYEDIIKLDYQPSDNIPIKQNNYTYDELLDFFENKDELRYWLEVELNFHFI